MDDMDDMDDMDAYGIPILANREKQFP